MKGNDRRFIGSGQGIFVSKFSVLLCLNSHSESEFNNDILTISHTLYRED
jgi:hypothetical protein